MLTMFQQIRRLLKHSAVYGTGHILTRAVTFILLPYLTHKLTPQEYGAVTLLYTFVAIALVLYGYGFDVTFLRFFIPETDPGRRKATFSTIFWITLFTSTLYSILIALSAGWLASVVFEDPEAIGISSRYLLYLTAGLLLTETLCVFPYLYLRAVEKSIPFIGLKTTGVALNISLAIILISVFDRGVAGIFEANLVASIVQLMFLLPVILKNIRFTIQFNRLGEFFRFGLPNVPSQVFVMVIELANRKILEIILGIGIVGIFSAGYKLGLFMAVVVMGFRHAWQPFFLSIAGEADAKQTFSRIFTYFLLVASSLFLLLSFVIIPLMTTPLPIIGTLINQDYWDGLKVFPIILLAHICNGAYANFMVGVYIKKKTGLMPVVTGVAATVNIVGNILLIPLFDPIAGMMAAAWVTLASYFTLAALLYVLIRRHYRVDYEWKRVIILFICAAGIYFISLLPVFQAFWVLKILLLPVFYIALKFAGFFQADEIAALSRRLQAFKSKSQS